MAAPRERPNLASDEQQRMTQLRADATERMGIVNEHLRSCNRIAIDSTDVAAGTLAELAVQVKKLKKTRRKTKGRTKKRERKTKRRTKKTGKKDRF